jgi:hypothetical protein
MGSVSGERRFLRELVLPFDKGKPSATAGRKAKRSSSSWPGYPKEWRQIIEGEAAHVPA